MTQSRLLFISSATSYRNHAFVLAADKLNIPWMLVCDQSRAATHDTQTPVLDFANPDAVLHAIDMFHAELPFVAVLALDDSGAHIAVRIAQHLNLPHNSLDATIAARNKYVMRQALQRAPIKLPWFAVFHIATPIADVVPHVPWPCVLKPLELNGSRGVMRANTPGEFAHMHARLERLLQDIYPDHQQHQYLVESYIPGEEVALEAILDDGQLIPLALFDKPDPLVGPYFEETIYVTPSRLDNSTQQEILRVTAAAASAIGLQMGPLHAELRINEEGVFLIEVAGRSIGGLCSQTLQFGSDESLETLIVRQAIGRFADRPQRIGQAGGVMMIPIPSSGILQRIDGMDAARAVPGIDEITITAPLHQQIRTLPEGESYLGFIFASGQSSLIVEDALRRAHALLRIHIAPSITLLH